MVGGWVPTHFKVSLQLQLRLSWAVTTCSGARTGTRPRKSTAVLSVKRCSKRSTWCGSSTTWRSASGARGLACLCHICSKSFTSDQTQNMHVSYVHSIDRPFSCGMCTNSCKLKSKLTPHEMTHSDQYNYSCETCGKQFRGKVNLSTHMKTHLS